ncbi:acetyl-CoA carboxylase biotin carboxyl carrier protein [Vagococcus vulneris]|uniref:Biotin carboxyl carrier protein of acetyl-CoA carboxylase n=1 Tax=Vagococcus vulneris TaxID=1977869 RepID=A0A429ZZ83_9ENTE|nr:acetyl-CoA carboxylase, biotin carboxyl carrier protein [Vagococcus vulneris]
MSFQEVKELMEFFESSSIRELNLSMESLSLYLSKNEQVTQLPVNQQSISEDSSSTNLDVLSKQPIMADSKESQESDVTPVKSDSKTVDAPIVGVVYTSNEPGAAPFKQVGDKVEIGDTLCIIEAMKIMNDVKSDQPGTITEVLIKNEDVVEYGQPLFTII